MRPSLILASMIIVAMPSTAMTAQYTIQALDDGFGNRYSEATDINNAGDVVGFAADGLQSLVALVWRNGAALEMARSVNAVAHVGGINGRGDAVGYVAVSLGAATDVWNPVWFAYRDGALSYYPSPRISDDGVGFAPWGINNLGVVAGRADDLNAASSVAATEFGGVVTPLPDIGGRSSWAVAVNDAGTVIGSIFLEEEQYRAFVRTADGVVTRITLFGGDIDQVTAINQAGTVVGASAVDFNGGRARAFVWQNGITTQLPVPEDCQSSFASDINENGDIVGNSHLINAEGYATLWAGGSALDLNQAIPSNSGWMLHYATGINDVGQIVGVGTFDGQTRAFLLTPAGLSSVPEPACIGGAIAPAALAAMRRRRRSA